MDIYSKLLQLRVHQLRHELTRWNVHLGDNKDQDRTWGRLCEPGGRLGAFVSCGRSRRVWASPSAVWSTDWLTPLTLNCCCAGAEAPINLPFWPISCKISGFFFRFCAFCEHKDQLYSNSASIQKRGSRAVARLAWQVLHLRIRYLLLSLFSRCMFFVMEAKVWGFYLHARIFIKVCASCQRNKAWRG